MQYSGELLRNYAHTYTHHNLYYCIVYNIMIVPSMYPFKNLMYTREKSLATQCHVVLGQLEVPMCP